MRKEEFIDRVTRQINKALGDRVSPSHVLDLRLFVHKGGIDDIYKIFDIEALDDLYDIVKNERSWYIDIYENLDNNRGSFCTDYCVIQLAN